MAVFGIQALQSATESPSAEERVDEYVNGIGEKEFFAADSQFRATYPVLPQRSTEEVGAGENASEIILYTSYLGDKEFSVGTFDVPPEALVDLNLVVNAAAEGVDGRVESATSTTWQGFSAVEAVVSIPDRRGSVRMLTVLTPQRVYMLQVFSLKDSTDEYEKFKASFYIAL